METKRAMLLTSIRNKLIVFSCSISLIPLVLVMMMCYQISRKTLTKNTLNELAAIAESKRMHFNCFMAARRDRVVDFSSDGFIRTRLDQMNREGEKRENRRIPEPPSSGAQETAGFAYHGRNRSGPGWKGCCGE